MDVVILTRQERYEALKKAVSELTYEEKILLLAFLDTLKLERYVKS